MLLVAVAFFISTVEGYKLPQKASDSQPQLLPKIIDATKLAAECSKGIYYTAPYDSCESLEFENGMSHAEMLMLNPQLDCNDLRVKPKRKFPVCLRRCVPAWSDGVSKASSPAMTTKIPLTPMAPRDGVTPDCDLPYVTLPFENCASLLEHLRLTPDDFAFLNPELSCDRLAVGTQICIQACIPN